VVFWAAGVGGVAYLGLVAANWSSIVAAVFSNSDAAAPGVIAECLVVRGCAHGQVVLGQISYFTTLWFDLATAGLPFHHALWRVAPYLLSLVGVGVLTWTGWRLGGRRPAILSFAIGVASSSVVLYASVAQAFHATTWFSTIVLGSVLAVAARRPNLSRRWIVMSSAGLSLLVGANLASDPLLGVGGLLPFVAAPAVIWVRTRGPADARIAAFAAATVSGAVAVAAAVASVMGAWGFTTAPLIGGRAGLARPGELGHNLVLLGNDLAALADAGPIGSGSIAIRVARTMILMVAAGVVVLVVYQAGRPIIGRAQEARSADRARSLYLLFWGTMVIVLCFSFLVSNVPAGTGAASSRYLIGLSYAAAAVLPLLPLRSSRGSTTVAFAAAAFCVASCLAVARGDLPAAKAQLPLVRYGDSVLRDLEQRGLTRGYGGYWEAASLSSKSADSILVAPVAVCRVSHADLLCPYRLNAISSWYRPGSSTRSFLITDATRDSFGDAMGRLGSPSETIRYGPITLRIYDHDIAPGLAPELRRIGR